MSFGALSKPVELPRVPAHHAPAAGLGSPAAAPSGLAAAHFAAALAFFGAGALGLVLVAPELAGGAFYAPRVVAVVHLFTLGWLVLSIFGALCQFLPVAVGRPLRWRWAARASFAAQAAGAATFVLALATGNAALLQAGACALAAAFVVFAVNLAATLALVRDRTVTWWALAAASVFLVVTPAYGVVLAWNLASGGLAMERFSVVAIHAHIAIVGVVLLVIVGVAHRLLRVWFYRDANRPPPTAPSSSEHEPPPDDDLVVLDVRDLEPPEPMVRTLEALASLPRGKTLVQINARVPRFLLEKLEERGFAWEIHEQSAEVVRLFIRHVTAD